MKRLSPYLHIDVFGGKNRRSVIRHNIRSIFLDLYDNQYISSATITQNQHNRPPFTSTAGSTVQSKKGCLMAVSKSLAGIYSWPICRANLHSAKGQ